MTDTAAIRGVALDARTKDFDGALDLVIEREQENDAADERFQRRPQPCLVVHVVVSVTAIVMREVGDTSPRRPSDE